MRTIFWVIIISLFAISCNSTRVLEKNFDFSERYWPEDSIIDFPIEIDDSSISYELSLNLRNTSDYPFQNIYIGYWIKNDMDSVLFTNTIDLTKLDNFQLFDPKTGEPTGKGLGDILEHRFILQDSLLFNEKGKYNISFQHFMRKKELPGIVSVGFRLDNPEIE